MVMMMDDQKVLSETRQYDDNQKFGNINKMSQKKFVFFADDSLVARKQIEKTFAAMGIEYAYAINGKRAWEELQKLAKQAELLGRPLKEMVNLILTDVEMPEMDGYMLTKMVKSDPRFIGIPVLMHSSLSGVSNQKLGQSVGVDEYMAKFEPHKLADKVVQLLENQAR
jgi:two-component system chemotaxis response regulator CheV